MPQSSLRSPLAELWTSRHLNRLIRIATEDDNDFLRALSYTVKAENFAPLGLPAAMLDMMLEQQFRAQAKGYAQMYPEAETGLILAAGAPRGRIMITALDQARLHVIDLALLPDARGMGLGTAVLLGLIAAAQDERYKHVTLSVASFNMAAARLYGRLGFQTVSDIDAAPASRAMSLAL